MPRPAVRGLLALVLVLGWFSLTTWAAPPASAHAVVTSSTPGDKEKLSKAPTEVSIQFSEGVTAELSGLKVLSSSGDQVDNGDSSQPTATSVRATLRADLPDGTYIANYKVVSADGHPITGAIVFGVGTAAIGDVSGLAATNDPALDVLSKLGQFVMYLGALMAAGLAFFVGFIHDGGADRRALSRIARAATVVAALGIVVLILTQAALATGNGIGAAFDLTTLRSVLKQGLGWQSATMLIGLAMCHVAVDAKRSVVAQALAFYGGITVTASFVLWGHATEAEQSWLSIPADIVHVAVAAVWFGGLTGLVLVLRTRMRAAAEAGAALPHLAGVTEPAVISSTTADDALPAHVTSVGSTATATALLDRPTGDDAGGTPDPADRAAPSLTTTDTDPSTEPALPEPGSFAATVLVVNRFSLAAAISVAVLIVAGLALGFTEVGSFGSLTSTTYGQLLLAKSAAVSVVLFLAMYNRFFLLPWLLPADGPGDQDRVDLQADTATEQEEAAQRAGWRTLFTTVVLEALIIVAVLGITAVLVNTTPSRTTVEPAGPFEQTQPFKDGSVSLIVTPNTPGGNNVHLDFIAADGTIADPAQKVTLELRLPAKDIGPFTRDMIKGGKGHFLLEDLRDMSIAGEWEITLVIRISDFNQERVTFHDTVS